MLNVHFKRFAETFYYTYLSLIPAVASFYLIANMDNSSELSLFLLFGLFAIPMYVAIKVETFNFPQKLPDILAVLLAPLIPLITILIQDGQILKYFGWMMMIEFCSVLVGLIITGSLGGGIGKMDSAQEDFGEILRNPSQLFNNLKGMLIPLTFIVIIFGGLIPSFRPVWSNLTLLDVLGLCVPILINGYEYLKGLYSNYRNSYDYGWLAIVAMLVWFIALGVAAWQNNL